MSIANSTLHFHFPLVTGTDRPLFEDYNQAMETLDEKLYESISTLETIPQEITDLQTAVNGMAEQITALETFETEQTGTNQLVNNAILALQQAVAAIPTKFDSAGIADPYDAEHGTYIVGDVVTYNGQRYECSQAVTAAEPFDADKWSAIDVQTVINTIKSELAKHTISVTADGVKTYSQLLNSLYTAVSALTDEEFLNSKLVLTDGSVFYNVFMPWAKRSNVISYSRSANSGTDTTNCERVSILSSASVMDMVSSKTDGTVTRTDDSSTVATLGYVFKVIY